MVVVSGSRREGLSLAGDGSRDARGQAADSATDLWQLLYVGADSSPCNPEPFSPSFEILLQSVFDRNVFTVVNFSRNAVGSSQEIRTGQLPPTPLPRLRHTLGTVIRYSHKLIAAF